jgi:hypothetical protein
MKLDIIAIVIAAMSAVFTGVMAYLLAKEQKYRLRPFVYVDRIDQNVSGGKVEWQVITKNCGLLPATKTITVVTLYADKTQKNVAMSEKPSRAIILP